MLHDWALQLCRDSTGESSVAKPSSWWVVVVGSVKDNAIASMQKSQREKVARKYPPDPANIFRPNFPTHFRAKFCKIHSCRIGQQFADTNFLTWSGQFCEHIFRPSFWKYLLGKFADIFAANIFLPYVLQSSVTHHSQADKGRIEVVPRSLQDHLIL